MSSDIIGKTIAGYQVVEFIGRGEWELCTRPVISDSIVMSH